MDWVEFHDERGRSWIQGLSGGKVHGIKSRLHTGSILVLPHPHSPLTTQLLHEREFSSVEFASCDLDSLRKGGRWVEWSEKEMWDPSCSNYIVGFGPRVLKYSTWPWLPSDVKTREFTSGILRWIGSCLIDACIST